MSQTSAEIEGMQGDVDADGEIVDALTRRLAGAIGPYRSVDVDAEEQLAMVRRLLPLEARA